MAHDLFEQGASLREISQELGIPKSTARLAVKSKNPNLKRSKSFPRKPGVGGSPYGFIWIMGKLVRDEKEQKVIQLIQKFRQQGMTFDAIATRLNRLKIRPRLAERWTRKTVKLAVTE